MAGFERTETAEEGEFAVTEFTSTGEGSSTETTIDLPNGGIAGAGVAVIGQRVEAEIQLIDEAGKIVAEIRAEAGQSVSQIWDKGLERVRRIRVRIKDFFGDAKAFIFRTFGDGWKKLKSKISCDKCRAILRFVIAMAAMAVGAYVTGGLSTAALQAKLALALQAIKELSRILPRELLDEVRQLFAALVPKLKLLLTPLDWAAEQICLGLKFCP